jgi:hypothetical protein
MVQIPPLRLEDVLDYYNEEVIPALAAAVIYENKFPDAVLNELRNALTHLARASSLPRGSDDYLDDLKAAYRHMKRTCLDCFKVSIIYSAEQIDRVMLALEEEFNLPEGVHTRLKSLRDERISLQVNEGVKTPDGEVLARYKTLFNAYDKFAVDLGVDFGSKASVERRTRKKRRASRRELLNLLIGFMIGVASSTVVALVFSYHQKLWPFGL